MAYNAFITILKNVQKDPNSDRLYTAQAMGEGVIVGGSAVEGQRIIYFPADGQICDYDFAMAFNLLRKDKDGQPAGGFLEQNAHIRALSLRGLRSEGIVIPLDRFAAYFKLTEDDFKDGETLTHIGDKEICRKYIPPVKEVRQNQGKSSDKGRKTKKVKYPQFAMHIDTSQLLYSENSFRPGDIVNISLKMHGTSQRTMRTYGEQTRGFFRRLFKMKPKRIPALVCGTRRTVVDTINKEGYYGNNSFRIPHHRKIGATASEGMEIFYEVVGWVNEHRTIMPIADNSKLKDKEFIKQYGKNTTFSYGCEPGESNAYIYRINDNGIEYTPEQIQEWCLARGLKWVPFFETFEFTTWEDLLERVNKYAEGPDAIDERHIREGVIIRILNNNFSFRAFKYKNFQFKILEGLAKLDASEPDMEEAESIKEE